MVDGKRKADDGAPCKRRLPRPRESGRQRPELPEVGVVDDRALVVVHEWRGEAVPICHERPCDEQHREPARPPRRPPVSRYSCPSYLRRFLLVWTRSQRLPSAPAQTAPARSLLRNRFPNLFHGRIDLEVHEDLAKF